MSYYSRKSPRIPHFDYSQENYFFITVCTHNRRCIFWDGLKLSQIGEIAGKLIEEITTHYNGVKIDKYVEMPNHIHLIMALSNDGKMMQSRS